MHKVAEQVQAAIDVPLLHIGDVVADAYALYLERPPTASETTFWSGQLAGGTEAREVVGNRGVMLDVFSLRSRAGRWQCRAAR